MDGVIQNVAQLHVVTSPRQRHQSKILTMNILEIVSAMLSLRFNIFRYCFVEIYNRMHTPLQGFQNISKKHVSKIAAIVT